MTKEEIRELSIAKLKLKDELTLVDIGAGTGSVSVQASRYLPSGKVLAIEKKDEAIKLIHENCKKFGCSNIEVIKGQAEEIIRQIYDVDRIFIGGAGKELAAILSWASQVLKPGGRIVINAILLETYQDAMKVLNDKGFNPSSISVDIKRLKRLGTGHYYSPLNPVHIIWADKE
ncbi:precorrin-6Y C5,15-methyltransferase (decarboxylating) subunit CbiT [Vallitalea okinawensis]|uniref:precorrin-6Y C5,15-methyltransferase (decarboxylating) subunit CbiT n=1 Tax=Vallitalea okinawensis TaxID=2078660 RepID=UPI001300B485|nr:precorrin-6Y C5,15-methyltransferase (decarboxylating) subunit CbiT [Vallitalea okinawensis]